jgi:hypothetical protein
MSRRPIALFAFTLLLALTAAVRSAAETEDYSIDNYELTVQSQTGSTRVGVTMDITYRIRSGMKSTGFKYLGNYDVEQLSGQDSEGRVIKTWVDHQRETRVNWSFAAAGPGLKRVILTFTIPHAITNGTSNENRFEADWAGVFKVPVNKAVYRFIFPDNAVRSVVCTPSEYAIRERNNCRSIEMTQAPFHNATFEMTFWPRIVDGGWTLASLGRRTSRAWFSGSWLSRQLGNLLLWFVVLIFIGVILITRRVKRARTVSAGSSWWSSGSSCAGGSSCSSCGSSCGGGCGGGCGG